MQSVKMTGPNPFLQVLKQKRTQFKSDFETLFVEHITNA